MPPTASTRASSRSIALQMKAVRNRARLDPMLEALGGVAVAGVVAFAYWRIASGISTVGDFMGFVTALLMAAQPIRALGNLSARVQEGLAAAESFYGIVDELPRIAERPGAKPLVVRARRHQLRGRRLRLRRSRQRAARCANFTLACRAARRSPSSAVRVPASRRSQSRAAAVRRDRRPHPHRRPGRARRDARVAARRDRDRQPGRDAVRRHDRRQHRAGPARRVRGGDRRGRQGRGGARIHHRPARRLRHQ